MKNIIAITLLIFSFAFEGKSQNYTPITYAYNGTPTNGVKIKTNIPFTPGTQMPTIIIEGYNFGTSEPIGLIITYYGYSGGTNFNDPVNYYFYSPIMSSFGAYTPNIYLASENGKVILFLDQREYYQRFTVRCFAQGMVEQPGWFEGWTIADEPNTGIKSVLIPYKNRFKGDILMSGNGIWNSDGNVGIGTSTPNDKLHLYGGFNITNPTVTSQFMKLYISGAVGFIDGGPGALSMVYQGVQHIWRNPLAQDLMRIDPSGNVGIGTGTPTEKLAVNGKIRAKEIKVEAAPWPDYVFTKSYKLPTLEETEKHIKEKGHLQGIPSAQEVKANGIDLGEMNAKLLQKIEELTLHLIEMKKENTSLKQQVQEQSVKINLIMSKLNNTN